MDIKVIMSIEKLNDRLIDNNYNNNNKPTYYIRKKLMN